MLDPYDPLVSGDPQDPWKLLPRTLGGGRPPYSLKPPKPGKSNKNKTPMHITKQKRRAKRKARRNNK